MKKRVLLIERSSIIVEGITKILHNHTNFDVVATVDTFDRIAERIVVAKPDLILINPALVDFSKRNSFKSAFQGSPQTPLVALVYTYFDQQWLKHFDAVIEINDEPQKIIDKITEVMQNSSDKTESSDLYELSDRERDVLIELSKGQTNKEIAEKLHISVHTVITHRKNIVRKTGIKSAAGLAVYAMLNNLIES